MTFHRIHSLIIAVSLLTSVLAQPLASRAATASAATAPVSPDLLSVGDVARLPDSGHVRFVRATANGSLIFAGLADGGLSRSADGGRSWNRLRVGVAGVPGRDMLDLQIAPSNAKIVWAAGLTGTFRSVDAGLTWVEADMRTDAAGRALGSVLAVDARHPEAAYLAGYRNGGLYRTGDAGQTWQQVLAYPVSGVALDPANGAIVYAVSRTAGVQRSSDHGHTWSTGVLMPAYAGIGLETASSGRLLAVDGANGGLFVGLDGGIILRSPDGGRTWQSYSAGLPQSAQGQGYTVPYSLSATGGSSPHLYAIVPSGTPGGASGGTLYAASLLQAGVPLNTSTATPSPSRTSTSRPTASKTATATRTGTATRTSTATSSSTATPASSVTPALTATATLGATLSISATATISQTAVLGTTTTFTMVSSAVRPMSLAGTGASANTPTPSPSHISTLSLAPAALWGKVAADVDAVVVTSQSPLGRLIAAEAPRNAGYPALVTGAKDTVVYQVPAAQPGPIARIGDTGFAFGNTTIGYLSGINYEGPSDRPWQMWQDNKFDPVLIARDLDAAASAGYRVLRVFVQDPLPAQVLAGQFGHLDTLVTLAQQRDLRFLVTFNDSRDANMTRVAAVDRAIAARYAGSTTIFGYDLQNEPAFQDIVGAIYPAGTTLPLLNQGLINSYGAHYKLASIQSDRKAGKWQTGPFAHMTAQQVWQYLNAASIVDSYLSASPNKAAVSPGGHWWPLLSAINASLKVFIDSQLKAVRAVDRTHLVTVGYNSQFWATLSANDALSFRSMHLYPSSQNYASIHNSLRSFEDLAAGSRSPAVLEEYGFSTAFQSGATASVQETGISLYLRVLGGAGDFKWQLNDDTVGYNAVENGLGLFGAKNAPKAGFYVNRELAAYFSGPHQPGGMRMWSDKSAGLGYVYSASDALGVSGGSYSDARVTYTARGKPAAAQLWLDWASAGRLRLVSTHEADLSLNLAALTGTASGAMALSPSQQYTQSGSKVSLHLQAGTWYTVSYTPGKVPAPPVDLPAPARSDGWYILSTGHNVVAPFLSQWLALGGESVAGAPLAEAQPAQSGAVQYFTSVAMQAHGGTASLLPLGLAENGGRPDAAAAELPKKQTHLYFVATGHNLSGAFLQYWKSTGGQAVWGSPIGEVKKKNGYTVQYFTNAEFVLSASSVVLGSVGARAWATLGH